MSAIGLRLYVIDLCIIRPSRDGVAIGISRSPPFHLLPTVVTPVLATILRGVGVVNLLPLSISEIQTGSVAVVD
ncbi:hypothetical protein [Streptomyces goshikiensis]|uniref:hypothetical protein n=1 Tax=Streptomyces goshikiensis TaxID=1942 RepID=UPI0033A2C66E